MQSKGKWRRFPFFIFYEQDCLVLHRLVIFGAVSLPLRITFEGADYTYRVLTKLIVKTTKLIRIELEDVQYELAPNEKGEWLAADATIADKQELLRAIARNVALRYRL